MAKGKVRRSSAAMAKKAAVDKRKKSVKTDTRATRIPRIGM